MLDPASPQIVCYLLNKEEIRVNDKALPPIRIFKAKALLFFLLAEHFYYQRSNHRREYLASLLWPDHRREAGLENLRQVFYQLRKQLKAAGIPSLFHSDRRQIAINPELEITTDLSAFQSGLADQLIALPAGRIEALPGLSFYEEEFLADWLEQFRASLHYDAVRAFSQALDREREKKNWSQVEQLAIRYLAQWDEPDNWGYESLAEACFFLRKPREAENWLGKAGWNADQIRQWRQEQQRWLESTAKGPGTIRLAALPLRNLGQLSNPYLSQGLLEDLIAELSVFEKLEVTPSLSVLSYAAWDLKIPQIAEQLAVEYLLYGTIQQFADRLSISMQLVQVKAERVVWSKTFDGNLNDLYSIQQKTVRSTLEGLKQKLALIPPSRAADIPSPEAYQLYLQGWSIYLRGNPEATWEAQKCFQQAVRITPHFHRAYLGLAAMYGSFASWWGHLRVRDVEEDFYRAIQKASEDSQLRFDVSGISAWFHMWQWNLSAAERDFQHAILQPTDTSFCFSGYTHLLMMQERFKEAYAIAQEGMIKNPNHVLHRSMLSEIFLLTGRYEECERICRTILLQMPEKHSSMTDLIWVLIRDGRPEEAIELGEAFLKETGQRLYFVVGRLALAYLAAGDIANAERLYREMEEQNEKGKKGYPYFMALYQQVAGRTDRALDLLEKYLPDQLSDYLWLKVQPEFKSLHGHPRFDSLLQAVFGPD